MTLPESKVPATAVRIKFARGFKVPTERERREALGELDDVHESQRAFFAPTPLFPPMGSPATPNDWLALYAEEGQTYPQFLEECPWIYERKVSKYSDEFNPAGNCIAERYPGGKIYLAQIGGFPPSAISPSFDRLREYAEIYLRIPVVSLGIFEVTEVDDGQMFLQIPEALLEQKRSKRASRASKRQSAIKLKFRSEGDARQLNCPALLSDLAKFIPSDGLCLIGLTMYDLYEAKPDLFVAGLASGRERVALFSFARYDPCLTFSQEFWHVLSTNKRLEKNLSRDERKKIVMGRSCKLLVHEIGHLMGLDHCIHYQCCMNGSGHLEEDFAQPMFLCPICLRKLRKLTNCDVKKRYEDMGKFFDTLDMTEEKSWIGQRLDR